MLACLGKLYLARLILLRSLRDIEKAANAPMMGTGPGVAGTSTLKLLINHQKLVGIFSIFAIYFSIFAILG